MRLFVFFSALLVRYSSCGGTNDIVCLLPRHFYYDPLVGGTNDIVCFYLGFFSVRPLELPCAALCGVSPKSASPLLTKCVRVIVPLVYFADLMQHHVNRRFLQGVLAANYKQIPFFPLTRWVKYVSTFPNPSDNVS